MTFSATLELFVATPVDDADTVTFAAGDPIGVVEPVLIVMSVDPLPLTLVGLKIAVVPVGRPAALNVTVPLKELTAATVKVVDVLVPP